MKGKLKVCLLSKKKKRKKKTRPTMRCRRRGTLNLFLRSTKSSERAQLREFICVCDEGSATGFTRRRWVWSNMQTRRNLLMLTGDTEPAPHNTSGRGQEGETFKAVTGELGGWWHVKSFTLWRGERASDCECEQTDRWRRKGWYNDKVTMSVWGQGDEREEEGDPGSKWWRG